MATLLRLLMAPRQHHHMYKIQLSVINSTRLGVETAAASRWHPARKPAEARAQTHPRYPPVALSHAAAYGPSSTKQRSGAASRGAIVAAMVTAMTSWAVRRPRKYSVEK